MSLETRKKRAAKVLRALEKYNNDVRKILSANKDLDLLYALTPARENILDWLEIRKDMAVLQVGGDYGAFAALLSSRAGSVTICEADETMQEILRRRTKDLVNVRILPEIPGESFDLVVVTGVEENPAEVLAEAKRHVVNDGLLLAAFDNRYGLKYMAGAEIRGASVTEEELKEMLPGADLYYPMPDWRIASEIYSDRRMPSKGELSGILKAYDVPEYLLTDIGEGLSRASEDGLFSRFASSYLAIWRAGDAVSQEVIYAKYNRTRRPEFRTKTEIREAAGERFVRKTALSQEGKDHIASFYEAYRRLPEAMPGLAYVKPEIAEDGMSADFPFLKGESLEAWLLTAGNTKEHMAESIAETVRTMFAEPEGGCPEWEMTDRFKEVFNLVGGLDIYPEELLAEKLAGKSFAVSNVDALFSNVLFLDGKMTAIDYEWIFDFPVPVTFLIWRTLSYYYRAHGKELPAGSEEEFFAALKDVCPADEELKEIFRRMEEGFQEYVHGDSQRLLQEKYMVETKTVSDLREVDRELSRTQERLTGVREELRAKEEELRKLREVHRLTENHVHNLDVIIRDLKNENGELAGTLNVYNENLSFFYRLRRKLSTIFNRKYPKGSVERKKLSYRKMAILHPFQYRKLVGTEEGRNLIKGDFEIGDEYKVHGRLIFPVIPEGVEPEVSIVIPVYNQIRYTYLCLVSILENTKDVTYEIRIADDVSTDATEHLGEFAENIVICRNSTNQGFLKNCNQAAAGARGKYIFFLNNDTQVKEGWLSSLVDLMKRDKSVGMCGSRLIYPDGRLQEAGGIIWSDGSGWNYGRLDDPEKPEYNYVKDVDYISGAAILIRADLWREIGGFDERYAPAYCEDSDLAFEVRKHGYRVVYQPKSVVVHYEGISNGTDVNGTGLKRYQVENGEKLKEKWKEELKLQSYNNGNPDPFRARERSQGKKILLVVDHYVPTWDKDAGSKTTYQYLRMFVEKGFQVKFLGDNFLHEEPYTSELEQMGIEVLYGDEYVSGIWDWISKHGKDIFAAYLNRPHIAAKYVDYIAEHTDIKMIFYGHDLHFLREFREYELTGDAAKYRESEYWKSVEFSIMRKAAMSYYPSEVEIEAIHEVDEDIRAKAITAYVYEEFLENINENFAEREGLLFVGGFAHPPNADAVLWFVEKVFPLIRAKKKVNFYIVGSRATEEIKALHNPEKGIIVKGFVSDEELASLYQSCRIVVVPLRFGAGVKGKVVEAIYHGAPIITTPVGSEGIPEAASVLLEEEHADTFAEAVVSLYDDIPRLKEMSEKTQEYIRGHYSIDAAWEVIRSDFE